MKYNMAIVINPQWSDADIERTKEMLIHRIAHQHDIDIDAVRRGAAFVARADSLLPERSILICSFEPRTELHVVWTRDQL